MFERPFFRVRELHPYLMARGHYHRSKSRKPTKRNTGAREGYAPSNLFACSCGKRSTYRKGLSCVCSDVGKRYQAPKSEKDSA